MKNKQVNQVIDRVSMLQYELNSFRKWTGISIYDEEPSIVDRKDESDKEIRIKGESVLEQVRFIERRLDGFLAALQKRQAETPNE